MSSFIYMAVDFFLKQDEVGFGENGGCGIAGLKKISEAAEKVGYKPFVVVPENNTKYSDTLFLMSDNKRKTVDKQGFLAILQAVAETKPDEFTDVHSDGTKLRLWWD